MLTVLLQAPDEHALRVLLAEPAYRELAERAGCHLFLIDGGSVTELTAGEPTDDRHRHAS